VRATKLSSFLYEPGARRQISFAPVGKIWKSRTEICEGKKSLAEVAGINLTSQRATYLPGGKDLKIVRKAAKLV